MSTLYNVVSSDWFIAREDGSEDFIPDELWPFTLEIYERFKTLIIGRKTYEAIQTYPEKLIKSLEALDLKKVVVTRDVNFKAKPGYVVIGKPEEALGASEDVIVSSGPTLNNYLFEHKLVDRVILHRIPVVVSKGILVFDEKYRELLRLESQSSLGVGEELIFLIEK